MSGHRPTLWRLLQVFKPIIYSFSLNVAEASPSWSHGARLGIYPGLLKKKKSVYFHRLFTFVSLVISLFVLHLNRLFSENMNTRVLFFSPWVSRWAWEWWAPFFGVEGSAPISQCHWLQTFSVKRKTKHLFCHFWTKPIRSKHLSFRSLNLSFSAPDLHETGINIWPGIHLFQPIKAKNTKKDKPISCTSIGCIKVSKQKKKRLRLHPNIRCERRHYDYRIINKHLCTYRCNKWHNESIKWEVGVKKFNCWKREVNWYNSTRYSLLFEFSQS